MIDSKCKICYYDLEMIYSTLISINVEKAFIKIHYTFMIKSVVKLRIEEMYLNIMKALYDMLIANLVLNGDKLKSFPLKSGARHGSTLSPLLFNIVLVFLDRAVRQE
jgi:hypothetical protein